MEIEEYISQQPADRQAIMSEIHQIIGENDKSVEAVIEPLMGKEMIVYKANGVMKYGLAAVKKHMSLHVLPMYCLKSLHAKYQALLPRAAFQKGCINFCAEGEMPPDIVRQLISDCAAFDLAKFKEDNLKMKKAKAQGDK